MRTQIVRESIKIVRMQKYCKSKKKKIVRKQKKKILREQKNCGKMPKKKIARM